MMIIKSWRWKTFYSRLNCNKVSIISIINKLWKLLRIQKIFSKSVPSDLLCKFFNSFGGSLRIPHERSINNPKKKKLYFLDKRRIRNEKEKRRKYKSDSLNLIRPFKDYPRNLVFLRGLESLSHIIKNLNTMESIVLE